MVEHNVCVGSNLGCSKFTTSFVPSAALVCRVDSKDIQFLLVFFWVQAEEVLPVLVEVVDQVSVEAVLSDNIDRAWEEHTR